MLLVGCGVPEPRRAIRGRVTVDGEPVASGAISFFPLEETPGPAATKLIEDGSYRFTKADGPYAGEHRVMVSVSVHSRDPAQTGKDSTSAKSPPTGGTGPRRQTRWETRFEIPAEGEVSKDFDFVSESP